MAEQVATNITWHDGTVTRDERQAVLKQKGCTIWFTGLSASGKSTIAVALEQVLHQRGHVAYRLDGDNVRMGLNKNLGFSAEDRAENIRRVGASLSLPSLAIIAAAKTVHKNMQKFPPQNTCQRKLCGSSWKLCASAFAEAQFSKSLQPHAWGSLQKLLQKPCAEADLFLFQFP